MRKTSIFMATAAIMILAAACGQQSKMQHNDAQRSEKNRTILEAYKKVLLGEVEYYDVEQKKNVLLNDYWSYFSENEYSGLINKEFTTVDLDGDGVPEAVIMCDPGLLKVFHEEEGTVYGFTFGFRAMNGLKKDGSYDWSGSAFHSGVRRQTFSGTNTNSVNIYESISNPDNEERNVYYIYYNRVTAQHSRDFWAARNKIEEVEWTPFTEETVRSLKEWGITQYMYASIPDPMFPIPMQRGAVIPYDGFSPPEEGYVMTTFSYEDDGFKESYKRQLREAGFVEQEGTPEWMESLWRYDRNNDGASFFVELHNEEDRFVISMYVNYFIETSLSADIQSIALALAAQVPEINEHYDRVFSSDDYGGWDINEDHYLYRYTEQTNDADRRKLQLYWYERPDAANDWVVVSYVDGTTQGFHPWLKCFAYDRQSGALNETELPFAIPPAHEFDNKEFTADHVYWRTGYSILMDGSIVISASPSMNATCVALARWDEKGGFTLFRRGINLSNSEPVDAAADAEQYVQNVILPNFQRIEANENWTWTDEKTVWDISLEGTSLKYYYSNAGVEKIVASCFGETYNATYEFYFLNRYLSFVFSQTKNYHGQVYADDFNPNDPNNYTVIERRWYMKDGSCFRGVGNDGEILSLADENIASDLIYETQRFFDVIMGK